jgi:hypothetical protein
MLDVEEVQKDLENLEHHPEVWLTENRKGNTTLLNEHVKNLGLDLDVILSDSCSLGRQFWKDYNLILINNIHRSLTIMNSFVKDIEKLNTVLRETKTGPTDFGELAIRWGRLKKSIYQIRKSVQQPLGRRKKHVGAHHSFLTAEPAPRSNNLSKL